jgi:uncharacterized membrane protein (UPF0127 family)
MTKTFNELQKHFLKLIAKQGCIFEDDYHDACYDANTMVVSDINDWILTAKIPLKRNRPKKYTQYNNKVWDVVRHPNVRNLRTSSKNKISLRINKVIEELKCNKFDTEFLPPWKKEAQRIDEEKRVLEDAIRSRQMQIPNWKELLERVRKSYDFKDLLAIWDEIHSPISARKEEVSATIKKADEEFIKEILSKKEPVQIKKYTTTKSTASFEKCSFNVYLAKSPMQKEAGLEPFEKIEKNEGMLFPFEEPSHVTFHMGKVRFPIDILFLVDGAFGLEVNKIVHNVQPGSDDIWSNSKTACVLELPGGSCKENEIKVGSICSIDQAGE